MNKFMCLLALVFSTNTSAAWLEAGGKVVGLATYSSSETILVTLSANGSPVAECSNKSTFAISKTMSEEARARMYAMVLAAKAAGTIITVAYNETGSCEPWGSAPSVYRQIKRMR